MHKAGWRGKAVVVLLLIILGVMVCGEYGVTAVNAAPQGLTNFNASQEAKNVYAYLGSIYGKAILAGQQESTRANNNPDAEMEYIRDNTGMLPAIRGLSYSNADCEGVTNRAIAWWNQGGIPLICWHWGGPTAGFDDAAGKLTIDLNQAFSVGSSLNAALLAELDRVAEELKKLRDAKVPILWQPFPETDATGFWWGKGGPEVFKKLWILMYDRFTDKHQLNNLIWVLGYSSEVKPDWYPGNAYVDIAGTQNSAGHEVKRVVDAAVPVGDDEGGPLLDLDALNSDATKWVWFLAGPDIYSKEPTRRRDLQQIYRHTKVITLDELPDLKSSSDRSRPDASPVVSSTPVRSAVGKPAYTIEYAIQNEWGCGATVMITIKNNGPEPLKGWKLTWTFAGDQLIANLWDGILTQTGQRVTVKNAVYNGIVPANGGTASFGFNMRFNEANPKPTDFQLNGTTCQVE